MVKSKYTFEKRQREKARQQKKEEKAARRTEAKQMKAGKEREAPSEELNVLDSETDTQTSREDLRNGSSENEDSAGKIERNISPEKP